jgi:hypothetical protein
MAKNTNTNFSKQTYFDNYKTKCSNKADLRVKNPKLDSMSVTHSQFEHFPIGQHSPEHNHAAFKTSPTNRSNQNQQNTHLLLPGLEQMENIVSPWQFG